MWFSSQYEIIIFSKEKGLPRDTLINALAYLPDPCEVHFAVTNWNKDWMDYLHSKGDSRRQNKFGIDMGEGTTDQILERFIEALWIKDGYPQKRPGYGLETEEIGSIVFYPLTCMCNDPIFRTIFNPSSRIVSNLFGDDAVYANLRLLEIFYGNRKTGWFRVRYHPGLHCTNTHETIKSMQKLSHSKREDLRYLIGEARPGDLERKLWQHGIPEYTKLFTITHLNGTDHGPKCVFDLARQLVKGFTDSRKDTPKYGVILQDRDKRYRYSAPMSIDKFLQNFDSLASITYQNLKSYSAPP